MLTGSLLALIFSNAFTLRKDLSVQFNRSLISIMVLSFIITHRSNSYIILKEGISLFGGLFNNTSISVSFHVFVMLVCIIIVQLTAFFPRKLYVFSGYPEKTDIIMENYKSSLELSSKIKEQYTIIEYPLIILFIITGAIFLISSNDTISIFLSLELQSYGLYILCALYRNSESSTSAGLTYFLLGGLSSCFILLAFGILYTNSAISNLNNFYILTNLSDLNEIIFSLQWYKHDYINYSLIILLVGFLFKINAAPFHFWSPDVYDAIPTVVTTFVANVAKISIFILLLDIVNYTGDFYTSSFNWTNILLISSFLSLVIGTVLGLNQPRIKKLLAYSTISHLGFMLLAISVNTAESTQAFIFYLMQYTISNVNTFIIIVSIGYTLFLYMGKEKYTDKLIDEENSPVQLTAQLKGYYYINPMISISMTIVIFSFVGIPPLIGFFGKQMVLSSAIDQGYIFLSVTAIVTSVISGVYYLNLIKEVFFTESDYKPSELIIGEIDLGKCIISLSTNIAITISWLTLIILLFILNPEQWLRISHILSVMTFN